MPIPREELEKKCLKSEEENELYWRCIRADVCPECGGKLERVQYGSGEFSVLARNCTLCKFSNQPHVRAEEEALKGKNIFQRLFSGW